MPVSHLDRLYRKLLLTKFFTKGWGSPENMKKLFNFRHKISDRPICYRLVPRDYPINIKNIVNKSDCRIIEGTFESPFAIYLPELVPEEVQNSYFQMIIPLKWKSEHKPLCIHLAGTGDHYFWRRRKIMAKPLLKAGIGAIIVENPYYGARKPKDQVRSSLHNVSDIFIMGGCLILECLVLLKWCEKFGFGPLGITGISMGGHIPHYRQPFATATSIVFPNRLGLVSLSVMLIIFVICKRRQVQNSRRFVSSKANVRNMASLAATNWPKPLVLVPCLSWSTASSVFTEGVMSESINWDLLQYQYETNGLFCDILSQKCKIVDNPFACDLSRNVPDNFYTCRPCLARNYSGNAKKEEYVNINDEIINADSDDNSRTKGFSTHESDDEES